jgi:hypothetical protein
MTETTVLMKLYFCADSPRHDRWRGNGVVFAHDDKSGGSLAEYSEWPV